VGEEKPRTQPWPRLGEEKSRTPLGQAWGGSRRPALGS